MISERINNVLNTQINKEFYSAYLYLSMGAFFHTGGLHGFANWCEVQAKEEVGHGMIIFNYINEVKGIIELLQINPPEINLKTPLDVFKAVLNHEKHITESINSIALIAEEENDTITRQFIDVFVAEQREEEDSVNAILDKLKLFGDSKSVLFEMDRELAKRE
jgi:ferritin